MRFSCGLLAGAEALAGGLVGALAVALAVAADLSHQAGAGAKGLGETTPGDSLLYAEELASTVADCDDGRGTAGRPPVPLVAAWLRIFET